MFHIVYKKIGGNNGKSGEDVVHLQVLHACVYLLLLIDSHGNETLILNGLFLSFLTFKHYINVSVW